jgi:hypothetical protein
LHGTLLLLSPPSVPQFLCSSAQQALPEKTKHETSEPDPCSVPARAELLLLATMFTQAPFNARMKFARDYAN